MNQVVDRKTLRREYLKRKSIGKSIVSVGLMMFGLLCIVSFWLILATLGLFVIVCFTLSTQFIQYFLATSAATVLSFSLTWISLHLVDRGQKVADIPYVPPVTASILPSQEVLVRSACMPPVAQSEVLLRAATGRQETPKQELLRGSLGE